MWLLYNFLQSFEDCFIMSQAYGCTTLSFSPYSFTSGCLPTDFHFTKTQLFLFGTTKQLQKLDFPLLSHRFPHFTSLSSVQGLGVTLNSSLIYLLKSYLQSHSFLLFPSETS